MSKMMPQICMWGRDLAGSGCQSESCLNPERGLHPPLSDLAKTHKVSHIHKLLCQSPQEPLPDGGFTSDCRQKRSRTGTASQISRVFQQTVFKMETLETIRTSPQQGEWVTLIDVKDAYFHIPIQEHSRKYLRFHVQERTYQFKVLPFSLSTAPKEVTVVAKEMKLMAIHKGIRIHQYLDDRLVRARSHQLCLQHIQDLVIMCQDLGWLVNLDKSELEPKQVSTL